MDPIPANPEYYPTPAWVVHRMLEALPLPAGRWIEPCVGEGHILDAVERLRSDVVWTTQDIRPTAVAEHVGDYMKRQPEAPRAGFDVGLTNPPFSKAVQIVTTMMRQCRHVSILQRLDWMGSAGRRDFFEATTPDVYVLPEKVAYVNGETDPSNHYGWYHWFEGSGNGELTWLKPTPSGQRKETATTEGDPRQIGMFG